MSTLNSCLLSATTLIALAGCRIEAQLPSDSVGAAGSPAPHVTEHSDADKPAMRAGAGRGSVSASRAPAAAGGSAEPARPVPSSGAGGDDDQAAWDDELPAEDSAPVGVAAGGGEVPNALIGSWYTSSGGTSIPFDPQTGKFGMQNGSGLLYHFGADGTYQKAFQSYASNAGCTTGYTAEESGSVQVSGSSLVLVPDDGVIHYRDNCAPSLDSDRPEDNLSTEQFTWQLTADGLSLVRSDGASSVFIRSQD